MDFQETEKNDKIIKALLLFKTNYQAPPKNGKARNYKYTLLADLLSAVNKQLGEVGCIIMQALTNRQIVTTIYHESGQYMRSVFHIPDLTQPNLGNDLQQYGAAVSYSRRYTIESFLGLASEDNDAQDVKTKPSKKITNKASEENKEKVRALINAIKLSNPELAKSITSRIAFEISSSGDVSNSFLEKIIKEINA